MLRMPPEQIRLVLAALENHRKGQQTHGARLRDALQHVQQSRNNKPAEAGLHCPVAGHHKQESCCD